MRLQLPYSVSNSSTLQEMIRFTSNALDKIQAIINGKIDLIDNGNNQILTFAFTKTGIDLGVAHNLGTVPRGFINIGSSVAMTLTSGKTASTSTILYLQTSAVGTVKVLVF